MDTFRHINYFDVIDCVPAEICSNNSHSHQQFYAAVNLYSTHHAGILLSYTIGWTKPPVCMCKKWQHAVIEVVCRGV